MNFLFFCFFKFIFISLVYGDIEFFPDFQQQQQQQQRVADNWNNKDLTPEDVIQKLADYFRRQQEKAEAAEVAASQEKEAEEYEEETEFTYQLPKPNTQVANPFAVGPNDERYYQPASFTEQPPEGRSGGFTRKVKSEDVIASTQLPIPMKIEKLVTTFDEEEDGLPYHSAIRQIPVKTDQSDLYFIAIVAGSGAAAIVGVVAAGITWYKLHKNAKAAADVEYPAYGVTGPNKDMSPTSGDKRLAQSAQMYHYQHQKQQIIAMENRASNERRGSVSEAESDEENEEGDYTVYECPGLASTGEMEVKNPLFQDDPTPASPAKQGNTDDVVDLK